VRIFSASPVLIALNVTDPQERLSRIVALADLIEDFSVKLAFDEDRFTGLIDATPPLLVDIAIA
jgi:hypothetical protein